MGVSGLEVKRHAGTGERVLVEINVRIPQSFGLGDACDVDASWRLYAAVAGHALAPQPPQRAGAVVVLPQLEAKAAWRRLRAADVTPAELLADYRGVRALGALDARDMGPARALAWNALRGAGRRVSARAVPSPVRSAASRALRRRSGRASERASG